VVERVQEVGGDEGGGREGERVESAVHRRRGKLT
jgi:hypothetical protein